MALLSKDVVSLARDVLAGGKEVIRHVSALRPPGIYEILGHDTTLELCDTEGNLAKVTRQQTVRFP